ncbi:MAG: DmsC/YnfH family molybdoenzyme membrane anchor subunit [Planctomycetota bacterium]
MDILKKREFQTSWLGSVAAYLFLGGLGAGAYVVAATASLLGDDWAPVTNAGLTISFPLVITGLIFLLAHLGSPKRAHRSAARLGSSWISRGVVIISIFMALSVIHFLGQVTPLGFVADAAEGSALKVVLPIAGIIFGLLVTLYTGALLSASKGFPLWRTGVLPVLFMVSALFTGLLGTMIAVAIVGASKITVMQFQDLALAGAGLALVELLVIFFFLHTAYRTTDSREGAESMATSPIFIFGDLLMGLLVPMIVLLMMYFKMGAASTTALAATGAVAGVLGLIGGFLLRFSVLSAGKQISLEASGFTFRSPATAPTLKTPIGRLPPQ